MQICTILVDREELTASMEKAIRSTDTGKGRIHLFPSGILHQTYQDGVELDIGDSTSEMKIYRKQYCRNVSRKPSPG